MGYDLEIIDPDHDKITTAIHLPGIIETDLIDLITEMDDKCGLIAVHIQGEPEVGEGIIHKGIPEKKRPFAVRAVYLINPDLTIVEIILYPGVPFFLIFQFSFDVRKGGISLFDQQVDRIQAVLDENQRIFHLQQAVDVVESQVDKRLILARATVIAFLATGVSQGDQDHVQPVFSNECIQKND